MKRTSVRKLSILGLVLMGASAVTAAILPQNQTKFDGNDNGTLRDDTSDGLSCITKAPEDQANCTKTALSSNVSTTAVVGGISVTALGSQTVGNTSNTGAQAGDQTSDTQPVD